MLAVRFLAVCTVAGLLVLPAGDATANSTTITYDFNSLSGGTLGGQDNWVSVPMGSSTTQQHEVLVPGVTPPTRNTSVVGHDGSKAARQPYGGASITSRSTRVNDANFDFSPVLANDQFVVEFDLLPPCWGGHFYLGVDGNGDGDLLPADAGFRLISYNGCVGRQVRIIGPDGTTTNESVTANPNDLYRYRLTFDRTTFGGAGSVSVDRRNLTLGGAWTQLASLQDLRMNFTSDGTASDPTTWDTMGILSDSYDPTSLFDNITFSSTSEPAAVDWSQAPPPWMKQYQPALDEECAAEWGPSWAEWPNGGLGGPVCVQTWFWSPSGWYVG